MKICAKLRWIIRACGLIYTVLPACAQVPPWDSAIAKVSVRADLNRSSATAFVVAIQNQTALLVTSAHVVVGDDSPIIEFRADPNHSQKAAVRNIQGSDPDHGLALLVVNNPPGSVRALASAGGPRPVAGQTVRIAGYPAQVGGYLAPSTTIAGVNGQDLILSLQADEGFSGGPVLRQDGSVVGLVWGHSGSFGVAMAADLVKLYLEGNGVAWGENGWWLGKWRAGKNETWPQAQTYDDLLIDLELSSDGQYSITGTMHYVKYVAGGVHMPLLAPDGPADRSYCEVSHSIRGVPPKILGQNPAETKIVVELQYLTTESRGNCSFLQVVPQGLNAGHGTIEFYSRDRSARAFLSESSALSLVRPQ